MVKWCNALFPKLRMGACCLSQDILILGQSRFGCGVLHQNDEKKMGWIIYLLATLIQNTFDFFLIRQIKITWTSCVQTYM